MGIILIDKMWDRLEIARQDSDTALFLTLLYCGEMVVKIVAAGMVAAIEDDRERHRYRQTHRLVRTDGLGDWSTAIDEILTGPAAQYLTDQSRNEQRELTSRNPSGSWQYEAVSLLHSCICTLEPGYEKLPTKISGRRWLSLFPILRNKTRGHGALPSELYGQLCPPLEQSIRLFADNFLLFKRPWAYLYRNLSGKYRVTKFTQPSTEFDILKTRSTSLNLQDGVYIYFDNLARVDLIHSTVDGIDFFFPNGGFDGKKFELISYLTNNKNEGDASSYLAPATPLPTSETQGIGSLEIQGKSFGNLPPVQKGYIIRKDLERELAAVLMNDRHPIITLMGRGGIGKTWLTLKVLHEVADSERFVAILWFSARDIDLMPQGPKLVTPHILNVADIAQEFVRLTQPSIAIEGSFNPEVYLSNMMSKSNLGSILFVFDNFETVKNPAELYSWIDTYIRLPNKVLITTRIRDFKGDYPVEVLGMNEEESDELIVSTASALSITHLLTESYKHELYQEANGHPYVMKVLLGEVAKVGKITKVERIVATIDDMLDALFERTFAGLSPVAKRVFLTLCNWRSTVPLLALEAVLLRPSNERMDVESASEELHRSSFIEISSSPQDDIFLTVPLVASVFGRRKLATSPMRSAIEADMQLLFAFGAAQQSEIKRGLAPRIDRLFRHIADRISQGKDTLESHIPMLEFIARQYSPAWLLIARLYQETDPVGNLDHIKEAIRRYIEATPKDFLQQESAWTDLGNICRQTSDFVGEIHALVEICQLQNVPFETISNAVNRVNALFVERYFALDSDEKRIVSQRLAQVMENRISEGDATDCSRLAWLFVRLQDTEKAKAIVDLGLSLDPENIHCTNLLKFLKF